MTGWALRPVGVRTAPRQALSAPARSPPLFAPPPVRWRRGRPHRAQGPRRRSSPQPRRGGARSDDAARHCLEAQRPGATALTETPWRSAMDRSASRSARCSRRGGVNCSFQLRHAWHALVDLPRRAPDEAPTGSPLHPSAPLPGRCLPGRLSGAVTNTIIKRSDEAKVNSVASGNPPHCGTPEAGPQRPPTVSGALPWGIRRAAPQTERPAS